MFIRNNTATVSFLGYLSRDQTLEGDFTPKIWVSVTKKEKYACLMFLIDPEAYNVSSKSYHSRAFLSSVLKDRSKDTMRGESN